MSVHTQNPEPFQSQNGSKNGSGFLLLHDFFAQVAITFLFCSSPNVYFS